MLRAAAIAAAIHFSAGSAAQAENCVGAWSDPQPYSVKVEGVELEISLLWDREQTTKIFIGERQEAISGIFVDTVALIAKEAGLTYDFVSDPDEADVLVGMLNGDEPLFPGYRRAINAYQPDTEKRG